MVILQGEVKEAQMFGRVFQLKTHQGVVFRRQRKRIPAYVKRTPKLDGLRMRRMKHST
jgi:hypothetical protein